MIREATLEDRAEFLRLWASHMAEQEKDGSFLCANRHNLYRYLEFFESYTLGNTDGICIVYACDDGSLAGVILTGEFPGPNDWEVSLGKLATLWGVYVQPSHRGQGISMKLTAKCFEIGRERKFDAVETFVRVSNVHGQRISRAAGNQVHMEQHITFLNNPKALTSNEALEALGREVTDG